MEPKTHWQLLVDDVQQQLLQVDTHISQCKAALSSEQNRAEAWLKDELANRDVDVDEIGQLKRQINQLKQDIQTPKTIVI